MLLEKEFREVKNNLLSFLSELEDDNIFSKEQIEEIKSLVEKEKIIVSVVGQMKFGKSTFVNAFIFGRPFLPSADTPMTAALTSIEYGNKGEYIAETFTKEDWESLKKLKEEYKKKGNEEYAKGLEDIIKKGEILFKENPSLLGKKVSVSSESKIKEYVGRDGKYVPITKMLTVKYPANILKEATLVDTPGFNDPVVERERRALEFIKKSDVVLVFLFGSRAFDVTDREVLTVKLSEAGIGKVLIVLNKVDEVFLENPGKEPEEVIEELKVYVRENLDKAIEEQLRSEKIKEILKKADIVPVSGLWALLGKMPEKELEDNEDLYYFYQNAIDDFDFISSKDDLLKYSNISELEEKIFDIVKNNKLVILKDKIQSRMIGIIQEKLTDVSSQLARNRRILESLEKTDEEIERELEILKDFRDNKYPQIFSKPDIKNDVEEIIEKNLSKIKNLIKRTKTYMYNYIFNLSEDDSKQGRYDVKTKAEIEIKGKLIDLEGNIENIIEEELIREIKRTLSNSIENLFEEFNHSELKDISKLSIQDLNNIKEIMLNDLKIIDKSLGLDGSISVDVEGEGKGLNFIFFTVGGIQTPVHEIKKSAYDVFEKKIYELNEKLAETIDQIYEAIENILGTAEAKFNEKVVEEINKSLIEAKSKRETNLKEKSNIEKSVKELELKKGFLEDKKKEIENKLNTILSVEVAV